MHTSGKVSFSKPLSRCEMKTSSTDEDYIDMDVNPTDFLCYSIASSPEFEFNMSLRENDSLTSPADELFYNGKLLPLHLPPRIHMVEKLLDSGNDEKVVSISSSKEVTPFESCNVTPSESCHVSGELNPDECFYDCTLSPVVNLDEVHGNSSSCSLKKGWSKRLKLIKNLSLGARLKASKAYFKSLFGKTGYSESSASKNNEKITKEEIPRNENSAKKLEDFDSRFGKSGWSESSSLTIDFPSNKETCLHTDLSAQNLKNSLKNRHIDPSMRNPFGRIYTPSRKTPVIENTGHRKSFSGVIKAYSSSGIWKPSSSSWSSPPEDSNGLKSFPVLKRSSSVKSDVESGSIQGAIAYCKQSQFLSPRRSTSEVGFFALTAASTVAARETQERPGLCRG